MSVSKPALKARLVPALDVPLSNVAFNFNLRRYSLVSLVGVVSLVLLVNPPGRRKGLTLVHFSPHPELFFVTETW